jgi:hypothetical protein
MHWLLETLPNGDEKKWFIPFKVMGDLEDYSVFNFRYNGIYIWNPEFIEGNYLLVPDEYYTGETIRLEFLHDLENVKRITIKPHNYGFYNKNLNIEYLLTNKLRYQYGVNIGELIQITPEITVEITKILNNNEEPIEYGKVCNLNIELDFEPMDNLEEEQRKEEEEKKKKEEEERINDLKKLAEMVRKKDTEGGVIFGLPVNYRELIKEYYVYDNKFKGKGKFIN